MNKKFFIVIVVLMAIIAGGIYWYLQKQPEKYTGPVEKITLAGYAGEAGVLVYMAENQGFFTKNGLEVTIKDYQSGKVATDALINGEVDISTSADSVLVSNSFEHTDLRVFGTVATFENKELVARKDKGITTTNDLIGKKIGVTKKSGGEFALGIFLILNDISQQDVEIVDLRPPEMLGAISNGDVDAVFTWDPNVYNIKKSLEENVISWPSSGDFYFVLLTKEDWLENNPKTAERFIKAMVETEDYIKDNSEKTKEFAKERFGYESDYIDYSWPKQEFSVVLPQSIILVFEDIARWRIKNGLTDAIKVPNYLNYIYLDALGAVKPDAVTIIR
ncbi:ABC transporter substrate-binding protein [Patescibacteria group bacterium]